MGEKWLIAEKSDLDWFENDKDFN